jgi:DNA-binding response OmpR family regulator
MNARTSTKTRLDQPPDILVIDDDIGMRELLSLHLSRAGYQVRTAIDAVSGGQMLMAARPDLVILDVRMPHMSGDQLLELLRGDAQLKSIKVIMLTVMQSERLDSTIERLGVSAFLKKPINKDELLESVAKALQA